MTTYTYRIHLRPEPEGGYTVLVPALPGCITWGKDYKHALAMAKECIEGFLEMLADIGESIPEEPTMIPLDTIVNVRIPAHV